MCTALDRYVSAWQGLGASLMLAGGRGLVRNNLLDLEVEDCSRATERCWEIVHVLCGTTAILDRRSRDIELSATLKIRAARRIQHNSSRRSLQNDLQILRFSRGLCDL
jgi:hypothetical protein